MEDQPSSKMPVSGALDLTERDLVPAIVAMSGLYRARVGILILLAIGAVGTVLARQGHVGDAVPQLVFFAVFAAVLLLGPRRTARRLLRALAGGAGAGVIRASYSFDAERATVRTGAAAASFAYRDLHRVRELVTVFLVYVTREVANIVVKRAFSADDLVTVRRLLVSRGAP
jgi:hypothetical protein